MGLLENESFFKRFFSKIRSTFWRPENPRLGDHVNHLFFQRSVQESNFMRRNKIVKHHKFWNRP